jgi:hypothetical protein
VTGASFQGLVEGGRGGGAFVVLPPEVLEKLGGGGRFRVRGQLGDVTFASSTMAMAGGHYCLGLHKATRLAAGVDVGDLAELEIERDDSPRELQLPPELMAALSADPAARTAFEGLSFSHRREYAEWVAGAKREQTRARRVAETMDRLRAGSSSPTPGPRPSS